MANVNRGAVLSLASWRDLAYTAGNAEVAAQDRLVRLAIGANSGASYANAQLDDYHITREMRWRPPLRLYVRARFSAAAPALRGTAGFGFWNDPVGMTRIRRAPMWMPRVRLPQAVWFFFAAAPSNMPWACNVPGAGWKAATLDASTLVARVLLPLAPLGMVLARWAFAYRTLWPVAQRLLKLEERALPVAMDAWHDYEIDWESGSVRFVVDGEVMLHTPFAPRGPLGLVIWVDNQYLVATPQGELRHGIVSTGAQWLELAALEVVAAS